jgi:hypothetical protein
MIAQRQDAVELEWLDKSDRFDRLFKRLRMRESRAGEDPEVVTTEAAPGVTVHSTDRKAHLRALVRARGGMS